MRWFGNHNLFEVGWRRAFYNSLASTRAGSCCSIQNKPILILAPHNTVIQEIHQVNIRLVKREKLVEIRQVSPEDVL
jgi:hypothetical protein